MDPIWLLVIVPLCVILGVLIGGVCHDAEQADAWEDGYNTRIREEAGVEPYQRRA
jgi:hypothetical protein